MKHIIIKFKQNQSISLALILLFAFTQSWAADFSCKMNTSDQEPSVSQANETNNYHSGHEMSNMSSMKMDANTQAEMMDCCVSECQCVQSNCANTVSMIYNTLQPDFDSNRTHSFGFKDHLILSQPSTALFRPPIFC